ncbi:unnamed protein product [Arabis nemorensis]|uniref:Mediator complex subunit 15 KIX domain-containing protein n=1 Tax=Arabis nemorensis TaxID=586526 RepID=A0A565APY1_9BRAS|nr:unnamed protein product [Arabis nemorensis]
MGTSLPTEKPTMESDGWRTQLTPDKREKVVNKIMEILMKHLLFSGPAGINELRRIAPRFEDKMFSSADSPVIYRSLNIYFVTDYLQKVATKMWTVEAKAQTTDGSLTSLPPANNTMLGSDFTPTRSIWRRVLTKSKQVYKGPNVTD